MNEIKWIVDSATFSDTMFMTFLQKTMDGYRRTLNLSPNEYAKKVQVPLHIVLAIENGIVKLDDLKISELNRILSFHNRTVKVVIS